MVEGSDWILHFQVYACQFLNIGRGQRALSQDPGRVGGRVYHRGGRGGCQSAAIENEVEPTSEFGDDILGCGEGGLSTDVRAGGGDGSGELGDYLPGSGMVRYAEADGVEPSGDHIGYQVGFADYYGHLAGPENFGKAEGGGRDISAVLIEVARVGDGCASRGP